MTMATSAPADDDGPYPSYCLVDLMVSTNSIVYSYRRNGVRFYVMIREQDLVGPGPLMDDFRAFITQMSDPEIVFEFEQWVLSCLDGFMKIAAPIQDRNKRMTLWDYYTAPVYAFHLINQRGRLCPVQDQYDPDIHGSDGPRTTISASLSEDDSLQSTSASTILRSTLPLVPHYLASQLERVSDGLLGHEMSGPPRKARLCAEAASKMPQGDHVFFFFKACIADHGHMREMTLLGRIAANHHQFHDPFRTSRLAGLVVWDDDEESLMGLLMDFIPGRTLGAELSAGLPSLAARRKWFAQVEGTVAQLHQADIIWGDVKPDNVMINDDGEAVLVDFGGGYTPRYIPRSMHETTEGDLIGLRKIKSEMGL